MKKEREWLIFNYRRKTPLPKKEDEKKSKSKEKTVEEEKTESEEDTILQEESEDEALAADEGLLLPRDVLLSAGIHIGTRVKTKNMNQFIYRVRPDGLFVLDVKKTDERIRIAAKFLSRYRPEQVAAVAARLYARHPVKEFCNATKATPIAGRFVPGLFSNPLYFNHLEPEVIIVSDPKADAQAVKEAGVMGIPVVALSSTDNESSGVDFVIPTNNKGRRALAVVYWLLARQILRERGELAPDKDLSLSIDDFEARISRV